MSKIAIIGGSAIPYLQAFQLQKKQVMETPYGLTSSPLHYGQFAGKNVIFLDRHGENRSTPPHKINYRANIWALHQCGVTQVIGLSIVGGIRTDMTSGHFVFPDQLIDYTYGRPNTFFDEEFDFSRHIDFTHPYCPELHKLLVNAAQELNLDFTDDATYGVTQGPRFETVAEINRLERDGCDVVGMTAMPEAVLARELNMHYACIGIVGGKAAGRSEGLRVDLTDIRHVIENSMQRMYELLSRVMVEL